MSDYEHPESGRIYREGDPTHRFAQLVQALARQCEAFSNRVMPEMGWDYLDQFRSWPGDLDRIARSMSETLAAIDQAYTDVVVDRDLHRYGLGEKDGEWERKYGDAQ